MKYLSCPDLHYSPVWRETSAMIFRAITSAAREHAVDFVALPGDLYDVPILACDKGGINEVRESMRQLRAICPIVAVEGTRSHDARGSYGPLSEWVTVLEPGKIYGLGVNEVVPWEFKDSPPRAILFGIPEITKETYMADHPDVSAEQANADILRLIEGLIDNEIAPMRAMFPDVPAIGLLHGNVSDASDRAFETDDILKRSDIVIKTDILARAGLTRWELGHIHTPWESKKISAGYAGYAGIDRNPWGKRDFVPAMNLVELTDVSPSITRLPYGTPERRKIFKPLDAYDRAVAYWLEASSADEQLPSDVHPWSRRTETAREVITRRVDSTEIESAKTITDLARMFDPELPPEVAACFDEIEKTVKHEDVKPRDVRVNRVRVSGCVMFGGATIDADVSNIPEGITQLAGANGSGKSSTAGWITPYPLFIGKGTDSGRASAIKDFFDGPESSIEKWITVNGIEHHHTITIKGAHTKTPKTECFLSVNGVPVLEKTSFDDMMTECERLYGKLDDYLKTSFYVQPLQGGFDSGLMTANMTTIRDLVMGISGIDRSREKRYALDRIAEKQSDIQRKEIEVRTFGENIPDENDIHARIKGLDEELALLADKQVRAQHDVSNAEGMLSFARTRAEMSRKEAERKAALDAEVKKLSDELSAKRTRLEDIAVRIASVPMAKNALERDEKVKKEYAAAVEARAVAEREAARVALANEKTASRVKEVQAEIRRIEAEDAAANDKGMAAYREELANMERITRQNADIESQIAFIDKPCVQCGYVDPATAARIAELRAALTPVPDASEPPVSVKTDTSALAAEVAIARYETPPVIPELPSQGMTAAEVTAYQSIVSSAAALEAEKRIIETETIPEKTARMNDLALEAAGISVEPVDISTYETAARNAKSAHEALLKESTRISAEIALAGQTLATIEDKYKKLEAMTADLESTRAAHAAWKSCDAMLAPAKIPAMELDACLDQIDRSASAYITPYRAGRYLFQTLTQDNGVDRFDIKVIDKETGRMRSMLKYSVGEKSFLSDAYTKALSLVRTQRTKATHTPVIMDEADGAIDDESLPEYYEIQKKYFKESGNRAIVITHSPKASAFIENKIDMKEIRR